MPDYSIELINNQMKLNRLINRLDSAPIIALDIETINWWNRHQERIALIQFGYYVDRQPKVAVIDALAKFDLEPLRRPLETNTITKIIHNAVFDANRLYNHFQFNVTPIYDTMVAARRSGERRYSLQAQAQAHLNLRLDKNLQSSDWSRRPLSPSQLHYAALDAYSTLLLYENQVKRNLNGNFQLKSTIVSTQESLPFSDLLTPKVLPPDEIKASPSANNVPLPQTNLVPSSMALLGIITKLPNRYHPDQLAVSVGSERVGLAGWIVDGILGTDTDLDEETAKLGIVDLCDRKLIRLTETRKLEATEKGEQVWNQRQSG